MKPLKVSEVNNYIKKVFNSDMILSNIEIEGEVSNCRKPYSGHLYFSLKDDKGIIKCVMFESYARNLDIELKEGQKVVVKGYISIYERSGEYQLYANSIYNTGIGELYRQYELLKTKLKEEGIFNDNYKKKIPIMPNRIGIVTSSTGAAIKDMLTVINRRFSICNILIYPSLVQGVEAPSNLIKGLNYLDNRDDVDLIIIGRGGGSIDELFAFNDEKLARAIFNCKTPVISAVGHETDFTISDFVADLRAATPSIAAELATSNIEDLLIVLNNKYNNLLDHHRTQLRMRESEIESLSRELKYNNPIFKVSDQRQELDWLFREIDRSFKEIIDTKSRELLEMENKLNLLDPVLNLKEGNGILINKKGVLIKSVKDLSHNEEFKIIMKDGLIDAIVKSKEERNGYDGN